MGSTKAGGDESAFATYQPVQPRSYDRVNPSAEGGWVFQLLPRALKQEDDVSRGGRFV